MTVVGDIAGSTADEKTTDTVAFAGQAAIDLVRAKAAEALFGRFAARRVAGHPDWVQVNRVDREGILLSNGWTYLVNSRSGKVVRTTIRSDELDFNSAVRSGTVC